METILDHIGELPNSITTFDPSAFDPTAIRRASPTPHFHCTYISFPSRLRCYMLIIGLHNSGYPALRAYTDNQGSGPIYKTKKRAIDSRLIISSETSHNATELCASDTSRGPDFVSLAEGVYCNMETREVKPVCPNSMGQDCFDVDVSQSRADRGGNGAMEGAKTFSDIIHWD